MIINMNRALLIGGILSFSVLLSLLAYSALRQPTFVVVDLKRAIQEPAHRLSHSQLSKSKQAMLMQRYAAMLPKVIQSYGASHHVTVIGASILVSQHQGMDITSVVMNQTFKSIKHDN